jgi:hypothetical protein
MEIPKNKGGKYELLFKGEDLVEFDHAVDANEALISRTESGLSNYSLPEEGKKYTKRGRPAKVKIEEPEPEVEPEEVDDNAPDPDAGTQPAVELEDGKPVPRRRRPRIAGMEPEEGE